ncbi:uncharacterized protein BDZ99DRAFT_385719, partial [Mytilinidion resinicola]
SQIYGHRKTTLIAAAAMAIGLFLCLCRAFGLQFCLMAVAVVALYLTLRLPGTDKPKSLHAAKRVDFLGALLLLLAVATPLFAINLGGDLLPWNHPVEIILLSLTPFFVSLFYYVETRVATSPIIPMRFIRMPAVIAVFACGLPINFAFDQLLYSFGTYLEARSFNASSTFSDWALTCVYLGRPFGTILGGIVIRHQPLLYAFFDLGLAVSGDLGIAISLATTGALVKSNLHSRLSHYSNADEVRHAQTPPARHV